MSTLTKFIDNYKCCASQPLVNKGYIHQIEPLTFYFECSQFDAKLIKKVKYGLILNVLGNTSIQPFDISDELISVFSHSKNYYSNIVSLTPKDKDSQLFILNIWAMGRKIKSYDCKDDLNDSFIHTKNVFGCFSWDYSDTILLYISEKSKKEIKNNLIDIGNGDEFLYSENFGERMANVKDPVINILLPFCPEVENLSLPSDYKDKSPCLKPYRTIELPDHIAPAHCIWHPRMEVDEKTQSKSHTIVFLAYDKRPYKTGILYITTRANAICAVTFSIDDDKQMNNNDNKIVPKKLVEIDGGGAFRNPVFSPTGEYLIYVEGRLGPHHTSSRIWIMDWATKTKALVLDWTPVITELLAKIIISPKEFNTFDAPNTLNIDLDIDDKTHEAPDLNPVFPCGNWPPAFTGFYNYTELSEPSLSPGIFITQKIENDSSIRFNLMFNTSCGTNNPIYLLTFNVNRTSSEISLKAKPSGIKLNCPILVNLTPTQGVWTPLDYKDGILFATYSSPNISPCLKYAKINLENYKTTSDDAALNWVDIDAIKSNPLDDALLFPKNYPDWRILTFPRPYDVPIKSIQHFECILMEPNNYSKDKNNNDHKYDGLIVIPHGGPHSQFLAGWSDVSTAMVLSNYALLFVNYVGSSGYGDAFIYELLGHVGTIEIQEIQLAAIKTVDILKTKMADPSAVFAYGGSYGGFSVLHLAAQYPDFYKAVIARNPVSNFPILYGTSDIPEYVNVELPPSASQDNGAYLAQLYHISPISRVTQIKCPILFLLGDSDLRVPWLQNVQMYRGLKHNGIKTKIYLYPDNHSLLQPKVNFDSFVKTMQWISDAKDN